MLKYPAALAIETKTARAKTSSRKGVRCKAAILAKIITCDNLLPLIL
jgi:hypothetical protein